MRASACARRAAGASDHDAASTARRGACGRGARGGGVGGCDAADGTEAAGVVAGVGGGGEALNDVVGVVVAVLDVLGDMPDGGVAGGGTCESVVRDVSAWGRIDGEDIQMRDPGDGEFY